jgi:hypothetical protein
MMDDDDDDDDDVECGPVGGMSCRRNRSTLGKPVPVPPSPPKITHEMT